MNGAKEKEINPNLFAASLSIHANHWFTYRLRIIKKYLQNRESFILISPMYCDTRRNTEIYFFFTDRAKEETIIIFFGLSAPKIACKSINIFMNILRRLKNMQIFFNLIEICQFSWFCIGFEFDLLWLRPNFHLNCISKGCSR